MKPKNEKTFVKVWIGRAIAKGSRARNWSPARGAIWGHSENVQWQATNEGSWSPEVTWGWGVSLPCVGSLFPLSASWLLGADLSSAQESCQSQQSWGPWAAISGTTNS